MGLGLPIRFLIEESWEYCKIRYQLCRKRWHVPSLSAQMCIRDRLTDQEWLKQLVLRNCPKMDEAQAEKEAIKILDSLHESEQNLDSLEKAAQQGTSKESWLSNKLQ